MTIDELRERLEEYDGDLEVRLMTQQAWPFENGIHGVTSTSEIRVVDDGAIVEDDEETEETEIVYLLEGAQLCYGSKAAWDAAS